VEIGVYICALKQFQPGTFTGYKILDGFAKSSRRRPKTQLKISGTSVVDRSFKTIHMSANLAPIVPVLRT